jgi:hypothetical protein
VTAPDRFDPLALAGSFAYLQSDVPPGVTLPAWRRRRAAAVAPNTEVASGADRGPEDRALRALWWPGRPRGGRGPSPRSYQ